VSEESKMVQSNAKALSEEDSSWSEPDVDASRKRMGLSQHVLTLIEKTGAFTRQQQQQLRRDSSEVDEQCRQRLKRFYALDYTEQDFSDNLNSPAIQEAQLNQTTKNIKGGECCFSILQIV